MSVKAICSSVLHLVLVGLVALVCSGPAYAQDTLELSSVETKFVLEDDAVLDAEGSITAQVRELLGLEPEYETREVAYLETASRDFINEDWTCRVRHKEGKKKLELTFKKRYAVEGTDVASALELARGQGFGEEADAWEAELDWGLEKMTLSISREEKAAFPEGVSTMGELGLGEAVRLVGEAMPALVRDWRYEGWGAERLGLALLAGPLSYERHTGSVEGVEVHVEVWPIPDGAGAVRHQCELSFKTATLEEAAATRDVVESFLERNGVLCHEDLLKTRAVLDAYLPAQEEPQPAEPGEPQPAEPGEPQPVDPAKPAAPDGHEAPHTPVRDHASEVFTVPVRRDVLPASMMWHAPSRLGGPRSTFEARPTDVQAPEKTEGAVAPVETVRQVEPVETARQVEPAAPVDPVTSVAGVDRQGVPQNVQQGAQQAGVGESVSQSVPEAVVSPTPAVDASVPAPLARTEDGSSSCCGLAAVAALAISLAVLLRQNSRSDRSREALSRHSA